MSHPRHSASTLAAIAIAIGGCGVDPSQGSDGAAAPASRPPPAIGRPQQIALIRDRRVSEISGIAPAPGYPGHYWVTNDSGDRSQLYLLAPDGRVRAILRVRDAENDDWEDLALGPGPEPAPASQTPRPWMHIADTGNNDRARTRLTLYRLPLPELGDAPFGATVKSEPAERLDFSYPGRPRDCEAMIVHPTRGDVYLLCKEQIICEVFRITGPQWNGAPVVATAVAVLRPGFQVTSADLHPGGERLLVRTYIQVLELEIGPGQEFEAIFAAPAVPRLRASLRELQGEAICYTADGDAFVTTSEGSPAPLHRTRLPPRPAAVPSARTRR